MLSTESGLWHIITSCNRYMVGYKPLPKYPVGLSENGGTTRCFPLLNHDSPQESDLKMRVFSDTKFQSMLFKLISLWKSLWATHLIWQGHCCGFKSSPEMQAVLYPSLNHSHRWLIVTQLPVCFPFQGTPLSPTCCSPSRVRLKQRTMRSSAHDVEGSWWPWRLCKLLILSVSISESGQDQSISGTKPLLWPPGLQETRPSKKPKRSAWDAQRDTWIAGNPGQWWGASGWSHIFLSMDDCEYQRQYCRVGSFSWVTE